MKYRTLSAIQAARATAGRHLLTNLLRSRYADPGDEDVSKTVVALAKKAERARKRKQAKARKQVSA